LLKDLKNIFYNTGEMPYFYRQIKLNP